LETIKNEIINESSSLRHNEKWDPQERRLVKELKRFVCAPEEHFLFTPSEVTNHRQVIKNCVLIFGGASIDT
jgi:hypothetical protein